MQSNQKSADELFSVALELEPDKRAGFLAEQCAGNTLLLVEVKSLLTFAEQAEALDFMEDPALELSAKQFVIDYEEEVPSGQLFGRYKILSQIGEGGMGKVYLAEDTELKRQVALKLISGRLPTREILRRFHNERRILANLQHPNIAQLLDGGSTEEGLPFFVMEYVAGQPLNDYADAHEMSTIERLKLFRTICAAINYAHQNLVIHRDIKPSNILVTSAGDPKLLDFGIAKLLHPADTVETPEATMTVMQVMTPEYASPEQVKGENITTASDVYSLGVLLYELLTGCRPYRLKSRKPEDLKKAICEQEPDRPSAASRDRRKRGHGDAGKEEANGSASPHLRVSASGLKGDLDNIVLMALRKEPARRYLSVAEFSEDIRRHLEGLPVAARKDTLSYRTSKFVGRNKLGVAAAVVILLTLIGGIAATTIEARRANRRFNDVRKLAHAVLFDYHDAIAALPGSTQVREKLVKDSLEYLDSLAKEAGNDVALQRELANAYAKVGDVQGGGSTTVGGTTLSFANLGDTAGALESHRKALAIRERLAALEPSNGEIRRDLVNSYISLGGIYAVLGQPDKAVDSFRQGIPIYEGLSAAEPDDESLRYGLVLIYEQMSKALGGFSVANIGDTKGAADYLRKAMAIDEELSAKHPDDDKLGQALAALYSRFGLMLFNNGDLAGALENDRKAVAIDEGLVNKDGTNTVFRRELAVQYGNAGRALFDLGEKAEALKSFRQAQVIYEALVTADPEDADIRRNSAVGYRNVGQALGGSGDRAGALDNFHKALQIFAGLVAKDPNNADVRRQQGLTYIRMSAFLLDTGDAMAAIEAARQGSAIDEALIIANPKNVSAVANLAVAYLQLGKCHALLASKAATPVDKQMGHWREAKGWYKKSFGIWQDMKSKGTLSGADAGKPDEVASEIAKCDAALGQQ